VLTSDEAAAEPVVVEHLSVRYGQRIALEDVSLTLHRGSLIGLLGPNGAGKSTLLRAILGLVPPCAGEVRVFRRPPSAVRERAAYIPQSGSLRADFPVSALDVVLMGRYRRRGWLRLPNRADREAAVTALEKVGMEEKCAEQFGALSGGQRQRVLVARALAQQADILLLDEPLNGIDYPAQEVILEIARDLRAEGKTIVMATHDLGSTLQVCDCLCCINRVLVAHGPCPETLRLDVLEQTYGARTSLRDMTGAASLLSTVGAQRG
jgi:ABC-type Mn2+/Zn2+ transport system ATPase subunit